MQCPIRLRSTTSPVGGTPGSDRGVHARRAPPGCSAENIHHRRWRSPRRRREGISDWDVPREVHGCRPRARGRLGRRPWRERGASSSSTRRSLPLGAVRRLVRRLQADAELGGVGLDRTCGATELESHDPRRGVLLRQTAEGLVIRGGPGLLVVGWRLRHVGTFSEHSRLKPSTSQCPWRVPSGSAPRAPATVPRQVSRLYPGPDRRLTPEIGACCIRFVVGFLIELHRCNQPRSPSYRRSPTSTGVMHTVSRCCGLGMSV